MEVSNPIAKALSFTKNSAYNISVGTPLQFYVYAGQSVLTGMITQHFHDAQSWAAENFGSAQLGHKRRTKRLVVTAHQIADQPEGSLPSKFPWNPLRAVYRLCNRPEVTHHGVTAPHFRLTRQRMDQPDPLLILHDTTELDFTSHQALRGTGPIGDGGGRGFLQHNSLAIHAETGEILGLAFQQIRTRKPCPKGETRVQRLKRWRESQLWTEGFQGVGPAPEGTCWVDIADRGADIFEAMRTALDLGHQFLFRATQDRKIRRGPEPTDKAAYLKPMTSLGGLCLELLSGKGLESAFLEEIGLKHETVLCHHGAVVPKTPMETRTVPWLHRLRLPPRGHLPNRHNGEPSVLSRSRVRCVSFSPLKSGNKSNKPPASTVAGTGFAGHCNPSS